ncbi:MAG: aspartate aminotransferase family protein [Pseudomonadota bacterium]
MSHLMSTYSPQPVAFVRGEGVWLWDSSGKRYLDALAGIAVSGLGHGHPKLVKAISQQAEKLIHVSNLVQVPEQEALADKLCEISAMDNAFFCNSGAEANECAIKLARLFGHKKGVDSPVVIVMEKAFHGRTLATLTATGSRKIQAGFEPLVTGFIRVPYNDIDSIKNLARQNPDVVAILMEVVQGEGGVNFAQAQYLRALRQLCDEQQWLLMFDEVQSGIGRTGKWFAYQHANILPDVVSLAKGLGSGVPIGACLARGPAAQLFKPGNHGTTFGGGPLVSTAALTTLNVLQEEDLLANAANIGAHLKTRFANDLKDVAGVVDVRGVGLMIGIELNRPCPEMVKMALDAGLIISVTSDSVIRLLPPLIMKQTEADELVDRLVPVIKSFFANATGPQATTR